MRAPQAPHFHSFAFLLIRRFFLKLFPSLFYISLLLLFLLIVLHRKYKEDS